MMNMILALIMAPIIGIGLIIGAGLNCQTLDLVNEIIENENNN